VAGAFRWYGQAPLDPGLASLEVEGAVAEYLAHQGYL
jgi:hypothetical protein